MQFICISFNANNSFVYASHETLKRLKTSKSIQALALYGFLIGVTMIGVYSWSVNRYQHAVPNCSNIKISNNNLTLCEIAILLR